MSNLLIINTINNKKAQKELELHKGERNLGAADAVIVQNLRKEDGNIDILSLQNNLDRQKLSKVKNCFEQILGEVVGLKNNAQVKTSDPTYNAGLQRTLEVVKARLTTIEQEDSKSPEPFLNGQYNADIGGVAVDLTDFNLKLWINGALNSDGEVEIDGDADLTKRAERGGLFAGISFDPGKHLYTSYTAAEALNIVFNDLVDVLGTLESIDDVVEKNTLFHNEGKSIVKNAIQGYIGISESDNIRDIKTYNDQIALIEGITNENRTNGAQIAKQALMS